MPLLSFIFLIEYFFFFASEAIMTSRDSCVFLEKEEDIDWYLLCVRVSLWPGVLGRSRAGRRTCAFIFPPTHSHPRRRKSSSPTPCRSSAQRHAPLLKLHPFPPQQNATGPSCAPTGRYLPPSTHPAVNFPPRTSFTSAPPPPPLLLYLRLLLLSLGLLLFFVSSPRTGG